MLARLLTCGVCAAFIFVGHANADSPTGCGVVALPDGSLIIEGKRYFTASAVKAEVDTLNKRTPLPAFYLIMGTLNRVQVAKALTIWPNATTPIETYVVQMRDR